MTRRLGIVFVLIVVVPLGALTWMGVRLARGEQEQLRHQFHEMLVGRLRDTDAAIARILERRERELLKLTRIEVVDSERIRETLRSEPSVTQIFVLDPQGRLLHPPLGQPLNERERAFLERNRGFLADKAFLRAAQAGGEGGAAAPGYGWHVGFWEQGINLVFWQRAKSGHVVGAEWERIRLLSEIVAELPQTDPLAPSLPDGRIALVDSRGSAVYQWGAYRPAEGTGALASIPLRHPLDTWRLDYFVPPESAEPLAATLGFQLALGLGAMGLALLVLALWFYRAWMRQVHEAAVRVNFVNQVSHELKTPLTNVRMYAELLERRIEDPDARRHLGVILSESARLGRLIGNVLAFGRARRGQLKLNPRDGRPDETVREVLAHFGPALEEKEVAVRFTPGAGGTAQFDPDALAQILGNLIGNVEKYGAAGKALEVATAREGDALVLTVADRGPGVPASLRERIFEPYFRASDKLTDGVAGAGIGLTIARELARLHGGDLTMEPSESGARFKLVLRAPAGEAPQAEGLPAAAN